MALLSLAVMIVLMVTGIVPNIVAALIACLLMGVFGCIDMASADRAIRWPTLLPIGGMLPLALALAVDKTGGIDLVASGLVDHLRASPYPFAMVVVLAAPAAFVTPVSSPVNTLVLDPGRYRVGDFVKVGAPFTAIVLLVAVLLVPVILPLHP